MKVEGYMRFEVEALRAEIKRKFKTFGAFALVMGISYQRMSKLVTNKADWSREEVYRAAELLGVLEEVERYFFTPKSQKDEIR